MAQLAPRRGANAVEFALSVPWALLLIVSTADFAMWTLTHHAVSRAVQDAARVSSRIAVPEGMDDGAPITDAAEDLTRNALGHWNAYAEGTNIEASWEADDADMMGS